MYVYNNSAKTFLHKKNGKYYFKHKKKEGSRHFSTRSFTIDFSRDFEIETSILKISGVQDYGMSFLLSLFSAIDCNSTLASLNLFFTKLTRLATAIPTTSDGLVR